MSKSYFNLLAVLSFVLLLFSCQEDELEKYESISYQKPSLNLNYYNDNVNNLFDKNEDLRNHI